MKAALPEATEQATRHEQLEDVLAPVDVALWKLEVEAWEMDNTLKNPFEGLYSCTWLCHSLHMDLTNFSFQYSRRTRFDWK